MRKQVCVFFPFSSQIWSPAKSHPVAINSLSTEEVKGKFVFSRRHTKPAKCTVSFQTAVNAVSGGSVPHSEMSAVYPLPHT